MADWTALWLFYDVLGIREYLSIALAFIGGLLVNYILSSRFVFTGIAKDKKHSTKFPVYLVTGIIGLVFTELFMLLFDSVLGIHYMASKIITTVLVFGWNFGSKKLILYRKRDED